MTCPARVAAGQQDADSDQVKPPNWTLSFLQASISRHGRKGRKEINRALRQRRAVARGFFKEIIMDTELPSEVWAILNESGRLMPPIDEDGTDIFMAWPTREQAEAGRKHQIETYGVDLADSRVVQVK
jgi:hypothetical protein